MTIRMTVQGPAPSETPMARFEWERAAAIWADAMAPALTTALRGKAPVAPENGGAFKRSIRAERHASTGLMTLVFGSSVPYAQYVISPTLPHTIRPRDAGQRPEARLHFTIEGGARVFAREVHHPGTKGNPFVKDVMDASGPLIRGALLKAIATVQGV